MLPARQHNRQVLLWTNTHPPCRYPIRAMNGPSDAPPHTTTPQVLQESYMMIPDSKSRLAKVLEEMEGFLSEHAGAEGLPADQIEEAKALLAKAGVA